MKYMIVCNNPKEGQEWRDRHNLSDSDTLIIDDPEVGWYFEKTYHERKPERLVFINLSR